MCKSGRIGSFQIELAALVMISAFALTNSDAGPLTQRGGVPSATVTVNTDDNIQDKVKQSGPGTTFLLKSGVHRLQVVQPKDNDAFVGEPGTILSGAALLTSFKAQGNLWMATLEPRKSGKGAGKCVPDHPACALPEDLFIDDAPLQRALDSSDVKAGGWYLDIEKGVVYLGENPSGHKVEISLVPYAFTGPARNVNIRGLTIEKYSPPAQFAAIENFAADEAPPSGWTVEATEVRWCHGAGVKLSSGGRLFKSKIHHNGQIGVFGRGEDVLIDGNEIAYNNFAGYDPNWEAGGTKFVGTKNLVVRNNFVHDNGGPGLWSDSENAHVLYEHNRTKANRIAGIFHEISLDAVIRFNTIENDGLNPRGYSSYGAGILVSASSHVEVYQNTVSNCMNGITAIQDDRGSSPKTGKPHVVQDLYVHDNVVTQASGVAAGIFKVSEKFDNSIFTNWNNRFQNNTYQLGDASAKAFNWMNKACTRDEWRRYGHDLQEKHQAVDTN